MTYETRRRQMREALMAKANRIIEADRQRRLDTIRTIDEFRRNRKKPYAPELFAAEIRNLFGDDKRTATIGE